jgi:hypothetical protein
VGAGHTDDPGDSKTRELYETPPDGNRAPHGGAQARAEALTYLRGQRDRYIVITKVTYQTFNQ